MTSDRNSRRPSRITVSLWAIAIGIGILAVASLIVGAVNG